MASIWHQIGHNVSLSRFHLHRCWRNSRRPNDDNKLATILMLSVHSFVAYMFVNESVIPLTCYRVGFLKLFKKFDVHVAM